MGEVTIRIGTLVLEGVDPHAAHDLRRRLASELEAWAHTGDLQGVSSSRNLTVELGSWPTGREARTVARGIGEALVSEGDR